MDTSSQALPSFDEIHTLHKKYAPTEIIFNKIFTHCQIVRDIALQLIDASGVKVNKELVIAGSLLHDIGAYEFFDAESGQLTKPHYITHGVRGEEILRQEGFSEELRRFASHHTGVGISKKEIEERDLPLPHVDFFAETLEEKLVMYADTFHSKGTHPVFKSPRHTMQSLAKFGIEHVDAFHMLEDLFGTPDLTVLSKTYNYDIRE